MIGIYRIYNQVKGKSYVGSSTDIYKRIDSHYSALKKGNHTNRELQKDFNDLGASFFAHEVLCLCEESKLIEWEQIHINHIQFVYNKRSSLIGSKSRGKKKREQICFRLPEDLISFIENESKRVNRTPSNYIETILKEHFELKDLQ